MDDLNEFLDHIKDIQGYLTALTVNFHGVEERIAEHMDFMNQIGRSDIDPHDLYDMLNSLYVELQMIIMNNDNTKAEILPCIKVIDDLKSLMTRTVH